MLMEKRENNSNGLEFKNKRIRVHNGGDTISTIQECTQKAPPNKSKCQWVTGYPTILKLFSFLSFPTDNRCF